MGNRKQRLFGTIGWVVLAFVIAKVGRIVLDWVVSVRPEWSVVLERVGGWLIGLVEPVEPLDRHDLVIVQARGAPVLRSIADPRGTIAGHCQGQWVAAPAGRSYCATAEPSAPEKAVWPRGAWRPGMAGYGWNDDIKPCACGSSQCQQVRQKPVRATQALERRPVRCPQWYG